MRVFVDSVGCRLNQSEIESIAAQFRSQGHDLVTRVEEAQIVVINTCAVTGKAVADSRHLIRRAAEREGVQVIATGCWAELEAQEIANLSQQVRVVGNQGKESIGLLFPPEPAAQLAAAGHARNAGRAPLPGERFRTRAFIKVQDGCDNHCTFCVTRIARGRAVSRPADAVLEDIRWAMAGGAREAVLTGVNLSSWGMDFDPGLRLADLVESILQGTNIERLRLSSLEPWNLDNRFFRLWENPRMCRHIHLPLQSGSDRVLKRMGRITNRQQFAEVVQAARQAVPQMAVSTDIIVGFPGEEEQQFEETLGFVREMRFESGHIFAYSPRPGTPAALLPGRLPAEALKSRSRRLRAGLAEQGRAYRQSFIGAELEVLWESSKQAETGVWQLKGLSDNYLKVEASSPADRWNRIDRVHILRVEKDVLIGEIVSNADVSAVENQPKIGPQKG